MMIKSGVAASILAGTVLCAPIAVSAQDIPAEYQEVLSSLGRQGDFKDNVLKVNIPRNDVKVTVAGVGHQVLRGDLVLLQDEVNPVMSVHGHGTAAELAQKLKPALALIGKSTGTPASQK